MSTLEVPHSCPHCGTAMECLSGIDHDTPPKPGNVNVSVCAECSGISIITEGLTLRPLTEIEQLKLYMSQDWPILEASIEALQRSKKNKNEKQRKKQ